MDSAREAGRRAQDRALRQFTRSMDVAAQDRRMKFERAHFAVVGEGSRTAHERYAEGYERINWGRP